MSLIVVIDDRVTNRNILAKLASSLGNDVTVRAFDDAASALDWTKIGRASCRERV